MNASEWLGILILIAIVSYEAVRHWYVNIVKRESMPLWEKLGRPRPFFARLIVMEERCLEKFILARQFRMHHGQIRSKGEVVRIVYIGYLVSLAMGIGWFLYTITSALV